MNFRDRKNGFSLLDVVIIIIITAITSALTTGLILFNGTKQLSSILTKDSTLNQFIKVYGELLDNYYEDIDKEGMINSAISAMMNYLGEDYSKYLDEDQTQALAQIISGYYEGIGISINMNKIIEEVHEDSPAEKVGILVGDEIIGLNDLNLAEFAYSDVTAKIKEFGNEEFTVTIKRGEEILNFQLKREKIVYPVVSKKVIEEDGRKIGYIYLSAFSNSAALQVEKAIKSFEQQEIDSLIIDLRSNSGGLLTAAKDIASLFLKKGEIIYSLEEKDKTTTIKDATEDMFDKKIIVLINGATASASEILTSALQESYGATVVGTKSYGKGKVQQTNHLDNGSMVKYTTAKWLTPSGDCIDGVGIIPNYEIDITIPEDKNEEIIDTQLLKAVELLTEETYNLH